MIIDFEDSNVKKIDSVVARFMKVNSGKFTKGQFRSFVVDSVLSKYSDSELLDLVVSYVRSYK